MGSSLGVRFSRDHGLGWLLKARLHADSPRPQRSNPADAPSKSRVQLNSTRLWAGQRAAVVERNEASEGPRCAWEATLFGRKTGVGVGVGVSVLVSVSVWVRGAQPREAAGSTCAVGSHALALRQGPHPGPRAPSPRARGAPRIHGISRPHAPHQGPAPPGDPTRGHAPALRPGFRGGVGGGLGTARSPRTRPTLGDITNALQAARARPARRAARWWRGPGPVGPRGL